MRGPLVHSAALGLSLLPRVGSSFCACFLEIWSFCLDLLPSLLENHGDFVLLNFFFTITSPKLGFGALSLFHFVGGFVLFYFYFLAWHPFRVESVPLYWAEGAVTLVCANLRLSLPHGDGTPWGCGRGRCSFRDREPLPPEWGQCSYPGPFSQYLSQQFAQLLYPINV